MHTSNVGGVIVQKRNDSIFERGCNFDLFVYFAFHTRAVSLLISRMPQKSIGIFCHVAANADRALCNQSLLARFLSTHVVEHGVLKDDQRVWNDLLERGIAFGLRTRNKEIISAR